VRQPWIQGQPWKVLEFQKNEKALNYFGKNGRPWKVWNLSIVKVSTRLGDCVNCRSCCKAGRRTAQTVLLINITHQCFKSVRFFSWVPVGLYAIEWLTGRRALNWPWIIEWKGLEKPSIFRTSGTGTLTVDYTRFVQAFLGRLPKVDLIILEGKNVRPSVRPQSFFDLNEIWYVGRGRWVMHDGMPYGQIQG